MWHFYWLAGLLVHRLIKGDIPPHAHVGSETGGLDYISPLHVGTVQTGKAQGWLVGLSPGTRVLIPCKHIALPCIGLT